VIEKLSAFEISFMIEELVGRICQLVFNDFQTRTEPGNGETNISLDSKLPKRCPWQFP
jgi:hypothetical protein